MKQVIARRFKVSTVVIVQLFVLILISGCEKANVSLSGNNTATRIPSLEDSVLTISSGTVAVSDSVSIQLTLYDQEGERIYMGGYVVEFFYSGGTSLGFITPPQDNKNGTYTASFKGTAAGTRIYFTAIIDGETVTSSPPSVEVVP